MVTGRTRKAEKPGGKPKARHGYLNSDPREDNRMNREGKEMNYSTTQSKSRDAAADMQSAATLLSAATITGDEVCKLQDEKLGKIQDLMLDVDVERLNNAAGVDKDQWPNMVDATWNSTVESCYAR
jgi:hypothetical protein